MSQENQQGSGNKLALPDVKTLTQAAKLSIKVSKPICFYFCRLCRNNCSIVSAMVIRLFTKITMNTHHQLKIHML